MDTTTIVTPFIALAATFIAHQLRDKNGLPHSVNAAFTLLAMFVLFALAYWLTTDLTGDLKHNVVVGLALLVSMSASGRELYVLWQILDDSPSPLVPPGGSNGA